MLLCVLRNVSIYHSALLLIFLSGGTNGFNEFIFLCIELITIRIKRTCAYLCVFLLVCALLCIDVHSMFFAELIHLDNGPTPDAVQLCVRGLNRRCECTEDCVDKLCSSGIFRFTGKVSCDKLP